MATLHVKDVPDAVYEELRARARESGRSIAEEVRRLLAGSLRCRRSRKELSADIEELRRRFSLASGHENDVDRIIREDRDR
jgi:plasmid stability protein